MENHIPEFKGQKVKIGKRRAETAEHPLSIRNLLNHLDGLPKNPTRSRATKTIKQRVLLAAKDPLMWEPGTKLMYGGEGLYVAAYLVEKYSGMPYTQFLKSRILDPLGMKNTYFTIKDVPGNRVVPRHSKPRKGKWKATETRDFTWGTGGNYFAVDGGFFSTVEDLFPWYQMLLNGGEYGGLRYLSEKSVRELTRKQTGDVKPAGHGAGNYYGLGFLAVVEPQGSTAALTKGSFGKGGAGGSITWVDPSTKTIYIMLQNAWGGDKNLTQSTFLNTAAKAIPSK
ncbi:MAG: serine hydrolase [Planctomycetota bacterium]|nr:serine hydrolase [Planctomycetota bacterium]